MSIIERKKIIQKPTTILLTLLFLGTFLTGCINTTYSIETSKSTSDNKLVIAYHMQDDYENIDENPQLFADYLSLELNMDVSLYPIDSEGAAIQALRFGNADIALMDSGAAWVAWQKYNLDALAADQESDGRTHYNAHAIVLNGSDIANAYLDDDPSTDPFALMEGKTSCHTGWLKSAGMLLPMGYLIGNGYANVIGNQNDIESLRYTIHGFFNENASIPDSGTPYYSYSGAVKCLSEGAGDVAFAKDSTVASYCDNMNISENEDWCLAMDQYILLPSYGSAPSHPIMYNPILMDATTKTKLQTIFTKMQDSKEGASILDNILNTPGLTTTSAEDHLYSYGNLIVQIPGITTYYDTKFNINSTTST